MTKPHNTIVILLSLTISAGIWMITLHKRQSIKKQNFAAKVFEGSDGWGYDILVDDKLLIHQESIPVLQGKTGFPKKEQAIQTAQLIINKLKQGQVPSITTFELERILPLNQMPYGQQRKTQ